MTNNTQASQQVPCGMTERELFERWFAEWSGDGKPEWQQERNCYKDFATHCAWKGWQKRALLAQSATATEDARRNEPKVGEKWYVKLPGHHELVLRTVDKITDKIVVLSFTKEKWSTGEYISYPTTYERGYVDLVESYFASLNRAALSKGIAHER